MVRILLLSFLAVQSSEALPVFRPFGAVFVIIERTPPCLLFVKEEGVPLFSKERVRVSSGL